MTFCHCRLTQENKEGLSVIYVAVVNEDINKVQIILDDAKQLNVLKVLIKTIDLDGLSPLD